MDNLKTSSLYRVIFQSQGEHCELYAVRVTQGHLAAFLEVEQISFAERDPANPVQERLRHALARVKRSYIPLQNISRIDEVPHETWTLAENNGGKIAPLRSGVSGRGK